MCMRRAVWGCMAKLRLHCGKICEFDVEIGKKIGYTYIKRFHFKNNGRGAAVVMGEVISVISGKGGTGKTTLCAAVATCMAADGKRVLCIDADIGLRNLDIALGMT